MQISIYTDVENRRPSKRSKDRHRHHHWNGIVDAITSYPIRLIQKYVRIIFALPLLKMFVLVKEREAFSS